MAFNFLNLNNNFNQSLFLAAIFNYIAPTRNSVNQHKIMKI